mmetsp:Transcript_74589/g.198966  ORF Transcript_74589/g.198966 Transcript_74589/m.198966 type:complete len:204 (-) Transcript_74589:510-1121(-)
MPRDSTSVDTNNLVFPERNSSMTLSRSAGSSFSGPVVCDPQISETVCPSSCSLFAMANAFLLVLKKHNGLAHTHGAVKVAKKLELLLVALGLHIHLRGVLHSQIFIPDTDHVGIRHHTDGETPNLFGERGREEQDLQERRLPKQLPYRMHLRPHVLTQHDISFVENQTPDIVDTQYALLRDIAHLAGGTDKHMSCLVHSFSLR